MVIWFKHHCVSLAKPKRSIFDGVFTKVLVLQVLNGLPQNLLLSVKIVPAQDGTQICPAVEQFLKIARGRLLEQRRELVAKTTILLLKQLEQLWQSSDRNS